MGEGRVTQVLNGVLSPTNGSHACPTRLMSYKESDHTVTSVFSKAPAQDRSILSTLYFFFPLGRYMSMSVCVHIGTHACEGQSSMWGVFLDHLMPGGFEAGSCIGLGVHRLARLCGQ